MPVTVSELGARVMRRLNLTVTGTIDLDGGAKVSISDVALRALQWLGVIAANETPEQADMDMAVSKVVSVHTGLLAAGIVYWPAPEIPLAMWEDYTRLVVLHLGPSFGKAMPADQQPVIEARIRRVVTIQRGPFVAEQAVMDVHSSLSARGLVRWSVFDIPDYAEGPYVLMASNMAAPAFGLPANPLDDARAMRELVQVIALGHGGESMEVSYF